MPTNNDRPVHKPGAELHSLSGITKRNLATRQFRWLMLPVVLWSAWLFMGQSSAMYINSALLELANKQAPLPNREWIMAGSKRDVQNLPNGPTTIDSRVLLGVDHNAVSAFVQISVNTTPATGGWGISEDCQQAADAAFTAVFEHKDRHYKCAFVKVLKSVPNAAAWPAAQALAASKGWQFPPHWFVVGIRLADRIDVIDIRYGFAPQTLLKNASPDTKATEAAFLSWTMGDIMLSPQDVALKTLIKWQETALYLAERGFRRQLEGEVPLPLPTASATQTTTPAVVLSRLQQLDTLNAAGWLTQDDFATQQSLIKTSLMTQADITVNVWQLGALKTAGHTTQSLFWMWGVNYLFLGNAYLAGGLALTKSVVSPVRYYLEELAWNTWGPRRNPSLPVVDFVPATDK